MLYDSEMVDMHDFDTIGPMAHVGKRSRGKLNFGQTLATYCLYLRILSASTTMMRTRAVITNRAIIPLTTIPITESSISASESIKQG